MVRERPPVPGVTRDTPDSASLGRTRGPKRGVAPVPTFAPGSAQRVDSGDRNPQRGEEMRGWHGATRSGAFVEHGGWCPCSTRKCGLERPKAVARSGLQRRPLEGVGPSPPGALLRGFVAVEQVRPLRVGMRHRRPHPLRVDPAPRGCAPGGPIQRHRQHVSRPVQHVRQRRHPQPDVVPPMAQPHRNQGRVPLS